MAKTVNVANTQQATKVGSAVFTKHSSVGSYDATGKSEFAAQIGMIDENIAKAIASGSVKLVDSIIYSVKALSSDTTVELMEAADQKKVGMRNLNKRQLEQSKYFLVYAIQVLVGKSSTDTSDDNVRAINDWKGVGSSTGSIRNGELEIKLGDKMFFPRNSMEVFAGKDERTGLEGYHRLDCPKMLSPLTDIVPQLWLPTAQEALTCVKIVFHGVQVNG